LEENDTLPEGVHVRMDMTTGEKWANLVDEEEGQGTQSSNAATSVAAAIVQKDGTVQIEESDDEEDQGYDIGMMHRTLSRMLDEEKERMGGLPELPAGRGMASLTPRELELFETRMKQIWERRQKELKELQESMMDLSEIIKDRIKSIRAYLEDPTTHLKEHDLDELAAKGTGDSYCFGAARSGVSAYRLGHDTRLPHAWWMAPASVSSCRRSSRLAKRYSNQQKDSQDGS
jgi:hypothetical protein